MPGIESSALPSTVRDLIARQPARHSLLGAFYSDPAIYALDLERVWRQGWLFAGHTCEIPNVGDYKLTRLLKLTAKSFRSVKEIFLSKKRTNRPIRGEEWSEKKAEPAKIL